jgi:hypothetical protein
MLKPIRRHNKGCKHFKSGGEWDSRINCNCPITIIGTIKAMKRIRESTCEYLPAPYDRDYESSMRLAMHWTATKRIEPLIDGFAPAEPAKPQAEKSPLGITMPTGALLIAGGAELTRSEQMLQEYFHRYMMWAIAEALQAGYTPEELERSFATQYETSFDPRSLSEALTRNVGPSSKRSPPMIPILDTSIIGHKPTIVTAIANRLVENSETG